MRRLTPFFLSLEFSAGSLLHTTRSHFPTALKYVEEPAKPSHRKLFTNASHSIQYCRLNRTPHVLDRSAGHADHKSHARLAQSVERETLTSTRSQGCGFDPRIGLFLYYDCERLRGFLFCISL
ncbi:Beta-glucuronidase [Fusarium oxysporum f. sp. albedinis]|nr:Beta-glucuronidase [Fusarium oxysporum f. sp. albedinis]